MTQNFFWPTNFFEPKPFFDPKFFLTKKFFDLKIFWPKFFYPKILLCNFFLQQVFFDQNIFLTKRIFWLQYLFTQFFFVPKIYTGKLLTTINFFTTFFGQITFGPKNIFDNFFLTKFFWLNFQHRNSSTTNQMGFDTIDIKLVMLHLLTKLFC